jgi:hypothetical protein
MNENNDDTLENSGESFVLFGDWRDEALLDAIGEALVLERQRERTEREDSLAPLRREVAELRGQVDAPAHPPPGRQGRGDRPAAKASRCGLRRTNSFS